jgi:hypothetical protein
MTMTQPAQFIDSAWPLLVVHLPAVMSMTAVQSIVDGYEVMLQRNQRFASVVDCSAVTKFPGAPERKVLTDWLGNEVRAEKERRLTVATAVVLTSGPMRAVVSAINWVRRPATPQIWTATRQEAVDWCRARLVEAGVPLTGATSTLRALLGSEKGVSRGSR